MLFTPGIAPLPAGPFRCIVADPPWRFATYSETGRDRSPDGPAIKPPKPPKPDPAGGPLFDDPDHPDLEKIDRIIARALGDESPMSNNPARHYETMDLEAIKAIPVQTVAADDCLLIMWVVDSMIPEALEVGKAWGFDFKTVAYYWAKRRRETSSRKGPDDDLICDRSFPMGTGYWTRGNPEQAFLFTRGQPRRLSAGVRKLILDPRREHSRKPDDSYARTQRLVAGPYLELFAREERPGWTVWGNQTDKFNEPLTGEVESMA